MNFYRKLKWLPAREIPPDVQEIIDYTALKKKNWRKNEQLKHKLGVAGTITLEQMRQLMDVLKRK